MKEILSGARFIGAQMPRYPQAPEGLTVGTVLPCIFADFSVTGPVRRATVYATALGVYTLYCNGAPVGDALLRPGWTDYKKLLYVQRYDVTQALRSGENRIGAMLGDGWFAGQLSNIGRENYGSDLLQLLLKLEICYEDGSVRTVCSGPAFRACEAPVRYADFYMGTCCDGRLPGPEAIFTPGRIQGQPVLLTDGTAAELAEDLSEPVRVVGRFQPLSAVRQPDGTVVYDFGQNIAGVCAMRISGTDGGTVTVRHGEMLCADGSIYTENLRTAASVDVYICRSGEQCHTPPFTFHGFRYVQLACEGAEVLSIEALALSSDLRQVGSFSCDNELVSKLYSNICWGRLGNFIDLPTDCPQRNERMGWCGDTQVFCKTAMYQADCRRFFQKYMRNLRDTIDPQGAPYDLAPYVWGLSYGTAAWADAVVVIPYQMYLFYGDKEIIRENLAAMEGWVAYQKNTSNALIRPAFGYGDWLSVHQDDTPKDLIGTAYFAYTAGLLSYLCGQVGLADRQRYYRQLKLQVCEAFCGRFMDADGRLEGDTQTDYLLALAFELVPPQQRSVMQSHLLRTISRDGDHLSCGFVGVSLLLPVLSECGCDELAYKLLLNDTYPSWGYSIRNGATTIWERWNSYTVDGGFGDTSMNSFNHYSLGSVGQWMYEHMCGIRLTQDNPGFSEAVIAPHIDPLCRIRSASARLETVRGTVAVRWHIADGRVTLEIEKPQDLPGKLIFAGKSCPLTTPQTTLTFPL